jgi:hypothetical protein
MAKTSVKCPKKGQKPVKFRCRYRKGTNLPYFFRLKVRHAALTPPFMPDKNGLQKLSGSK